ncbi:hypothetical protein Hokovirus_2_210 [Hokovirus HKV1]|mgnify:CR=1 FL=1|uniref:Glycine-rich domain-containing protein n=1 Tax=Hokovirus HKV1 TaxID=1977638 RepID=A0A1V0SG47_9VIRU|nr:hypothetical protein Hokovirus_2_210 [Hokovirus HKV1]
MDKINDKNIKIKIKNIMLNKMKEDIINLTERVKILESNNIKIPDNKTRDNKINEQRYKQIIGEINNTNNILDTINTYKTYITKYFCESATYKLEKETEIIFITMSGGGGAGGIGKIINNRMYNGYGGGGASGFIHYPIAVKKDTTLCITVGKGGDKYKNKGDGEDTIIEFYDSCNKMYFNIVSEGGKGGSEVDAGLGGKNYLIPSFSGQDGIKSGGNSIFGYGGEDGLDGYNGSGGGGSLALDYEDVITKKKTNCKLSGNGGNGFVIIEY